MVIIRTVVTNYEQYSQELFYFYVIWLAAVIEKTDISYRLGKIFLAQKYYKKHPYKSKQHPTKKQ